VRAVNLLPGDAQRRSRGAPNQAALAAAVAGVVVVAALGGGNLFEASRVAAAQRTLNDAKIQLAGTPLPPATPRVTPPPPVVAAQMAPRLQAVTAALSTRIAWDRILREFSLVLPSDIQLTQLTLTQPVSAAAASSGLTLTGVTYSYDSVARLLSRMALIPDLTNVILGPTTSASNIVSFSVRATVKGAAPAAVVPTLPTTTTTGSSS
jgi:Fimbrial assembly protein (PilN)